MSVFSGAATTVEAKRAETRRARSNASNVKLVCTTKPRDPEGQSIEVEVVNCSDIGISSVVIVVTTPFGEMELDGHIENQDTFRVPYAIERDATYSKVLPHLVRLPESSYDAEDDTDQPGVIGVLWWQDDIGRYWRRVGPELPEKMSKSSYP
jgi:hypothetical protein